MREGRSSGQQQIRNSQPGVFSLFHGFFSFPRPAPKDGG